MASCSLFSHCTHVAYTRSDTHIHINKMNRKKTKSIHQFLNFLNRTAHELMLCGTFSGEMQTDVCSSQRENKPQTKVQKPLESNLVDQGVLLGLLTGAETTQCCVTKSHLSIGDSSQNLRTWSSLCSLAAQEAGEFPILVDQIAL